MSDYAFSLERAREAAGLVSMIENRLAQSPNDVSLRINLMSAQRMAEDAQTRLQEAAADSQIDVCRYRLVSKIKDGFGLLSVSKSLELFQESFSFVYDALIDRPKQRARLSEQTKEDSKMLFGYSFAGSLGVVLLVPSERGFFSTRFDDVVATMNEIFDISTDDELKDAARKIGVAAINKIYAWSDSNFQSGFDLDLRWTKSSNTQTGRYLESKQFGKLADLISKTSDTENSTLVTSGTLVGFDSVYQTFHIVEPNGDSYKGKLANEFPILKDWTVNQRYKAVIRAETTIRYSTGEQTSRHFLMSLSDVP